MSQTSTSSAPSATPSAPAPVHALSWFEIPARDLARARRFYETVLGVPLREETMGGQRLAVFPYQPGAGVGGALIESAADQADTVCQPGPDGARVYLPAGPVLEDTLARVSLAGGRIAQPPLELPHGIGWIAVIVDPDGNRVGLHSRPA